jgi:hypothetical protein
MVKYGVDSALENVWVSRGSSPLSLFLYVTQVKCFLLLISLLLPLLSPGYKLLDSSFLILTHFHRAYLSISGVKVGRRSSVQILLLFDHRSCLFSLWNIKVKEGQFLLTRLYQLLPGLLSLVDLIFFSLRLVDSLNCISAPAATQVLLVSLCIESNVRGWRYSTIRGIGSKSGGRLWEIRFKGAE